MIRSPSKAIFEFSLNVFTEFSEFSDKNICHYSKRAGTCQLLCKKETRMLPQASKTHVKDRIFKLSPIHSSMIYQFPWIRWIHWIAVLFRKNSIVLYLFIILPRSLWETITDAKRTLSKSHRIRYFDLDQIYIFFKYDPTRHNIGTSRGGLGSWSCALLEIWLMWKKL